MGLLSPWYWLFILIVAVMIFGPGKLPDAGKASGDAIVISNAPSMKNLTKIKTMIWTNRIQVEFLSCKHA